MAGPGCTPALSSHGPRGIALRARSLRERLFEAEIFHKVEHLLLQGCRQGLHLFLNLFERRHDCFYFLVQNHSSYFERWRSCLHL